MLLGKAVGSHWLIEVRSRFSAAHQLMLAGEPIEPLHGHNYRVDLYIVPPDTLDDSGVSLDFQYVQKILDQAIQPLHMRNLNELEPFRSNSPSAEMIARYIADRFLDEWEGPGRLFAVRIWEDNDRNVTYFLESGP